MADDGAAGDGFGTSVSVNDDASLFGASFDDTEAGTNAGSAYVFSRTWDMWTQRGTLTAGDGGAGGRFGVPVSTQGLASVVGAHADMTHVNPDGILTVYDDRNSDGEMDVGESRPLAMTPSPP